jgi:hypothetical protein
MSHTKRLGLALGVVLAALCSAFGAQGPNQFTESGEYFLILDGNPCGLPKTVEGGAITAELIQEPPAPNAFIKKHVGPPKYEDFRIYVGFDMTDKVYDWIARSWSLTAPRVNGSLTALDRKWQPVSERQFSNAILTETTIPTLDGGYGVPTYLSLKFAPAQIRAGQPARQVNASQYTADPQKWWLSSDFKLEIAGLDCTGVRRIESFTVRLAGVSDNPGDARGSDQQPPRLQFPNLKITLSQRTAPSWLAWHDSLILQGRNDETCEKSGTLTFLARDHQKVLARIKLYNMGILRAELETGVVSANQANVVHAELYVERMEFLPGDKGGPSGATGAAGSGTTSGPKTTLSAPAPKVPKRPG